MTLLGRRTYTILAAGAGLLMLAGGPSAQAQGWQGASPFIVGTAEHGMENRPAANWSFTDGAADGSVHGPALHSHVKMDNQTMAELGAMIGLGLLGWSQMHGGNGGTDNVSHFASVLPPAGFTSSAGSGSTLGSTTAPVPEFGTGASFGLMTLLGIAGLSASRRKRPATTV